MKSKMLKIAIEMVGYVNLKSFHVLLLMINSSSNVDILSLQVFRVRFENL